MENSDGTTWFWRIFGGAIIGFMSLLLLWALNTLSSNVNIFRTEMLATIERIEKDTAEQISHLRDDIATIKAKIAAIEEFRNSTKDKITSVDNNIKERTEATQTTITELRERILKLEEKLSKIEKPNP